MVLEIVVAVFVGSVCFALLLYFINKVDLKQHSVDENTNSNNEETYSKSKGNKPTKSTKVKKIETKSAFSHDWLLVSLKGHTKSVLDFDISPNSKFIISCSEDRSCFLWTLKDISDKSHKSKKINIEYDHLAHICFSPDSKAFVGSLSNGNNLRIFRLNKSDDGGIGKVDEAGDFEDKLSSEIINIGISSNGRFIMTCHADTTIRVYSIKGEVLSTIDTGHMYNYHGGVSPCGRFVATSGFTPDVKIWEVVFDKSGIFKEVRRAFELKGHTSGIYSFAFNGDSSKVVTLSKDGSWKFWNIDVDYLRGQDPVLLYTGSYNHEANCRHGVALSPDARVMVIIQHNVVYLYSTGNGDLLATISHHFPEGLSQVLFDPKGRFIFLGDGRHIHVLHNVPDYQLTVKEMEEKQKTAPNKAAKERFAQLAEPAKNQLKALGIPV